MRFAEVVRQIMPIEKEFTERASVGFSLEKVVSDLKFAHESDDNKKDFDGTLLIPGGGMKIANSGGFLMALAEKDLIKDFKNIVAVSAGSMLAAYALSGQIETVKKLFFEESKNFIKQGILPKIDVDYVASLIQDGKYKLDLPALRRSQADFYIALASDNGSCELVNTKDYSDQDLINVIKAAMAAPFFYGKKVKVSGSSYEDAFTDQLPLKQTVDRLNPKNILVLENSSFYLRAKPFSKGFNAVLSVKQFGATNTINEFLDRPSYKDDFQKVESNPNVTLGVFFPPSYAEHLGGIETNTKILEKSYELCKQKALEKLN